MVKFEGAELSLAERTEMGRRYTAIHTLASEAILLMLIAQRKIPWHEIQPSLCWQPTTLGFTPAEILPDVEKHIEYLWGTGNLLRRIAEQREQTTNDM